MIKSCCVNFCRTRFPLVFPRNKLQQGALNFWLNALLHTADYLERCSVKTDLVVAVGVCVQLSSFGTLSYLSHSQTFVVRLHSLGCVCVFVCLGVLACVSEQMHMYKVEV